MQLVSGEWMNIRSLRGEWMCILLVLPVCKFLLSEWILFHLAEIVFLKLDCPFHYLSSSFRSSTAWWFVRGCLASFVWQNCCLSNSCLIRHLKWAVGFFWGSCHHVKRKEERAAVFYFSTESGNSVGCVDSHQLRSLHFRGRGSICGTNKNKSAVEEWIRNNK